MKKTKNSFSFLKKNEKIIEDLPIVKFDLFGVLNSTIDKINSKKYITKKDLELYKESDVATLGFFMTKYLLYTNLCKIIIDKVFQIQKILDKKEYFIWLCNFLIDSKIKMKKFLKVPVKFTRNKGMDEILEMMNITDISDEEKEYFKNYIENLGYSNKEFVSIMKALGEFSL